MVRNFNKVIVKEDGFEPRQYLKGTGLRLDRVGYSTVKEHVDILVSSGKILTRLLQGAALGAFALIF